MRLKSAILLYQLSAMAISALHRQCERKRVSRNSLDGRNWKIYLIETRNSQFKRTGIGNPLKWRFNSRQLLIRLDTLLEQPHSAGFVMVYEVFEICEGN